MKWLTDNFILIKENWPLSLIGKVNQYKWCSVMGCVLDMDLPWRTLRPKLARCDENGMVAYETTFEEMRIYHRYSGVCLMNLHDFCFITAVCLPLLIIILGFDCRKLRIKNEIIYSYLSCFVDVVLEWTNSDRNAL